jgi:hypothetical protein
MRKAPMATRSQTVFSRTSMGWIDYHRKLTGTVPDAPTVPSRNAISYHLFAARVASMLIAVVS